MQHYLPVWTRHDQWLDTRGNGGKLPKYTLAERFGASRGDALERCRAAASIARIAGTRAADTRLAKWLHRAFMPSLVVWGERDEIAPAAQARSWAALLPRAKARVIACTGPDVLRAPGAAAAVANLLSAPESSSAR